MALEGLTPQELAQLKLGRILASNPEIHRDAKRLAKKADPTLQIPEIELEDQVRAAEERAKEREQKLSDELMRERVARRQEEARRKVEAAGFTLEQIEKIMVDYGIASYDKAMQIAALERQTAEPTAAEVRQGSVPNSPIDVRPDKDWRTLDTGGLRRKSAAVAAEVIAEFRGQRRSAG